MLSEDENARWARYAGYIRGAKKRLPIGTRVKLSPEAARQFPRYKGVLGTVVGLQHGTSPRVLWDGRKTAGSGYAPWFIHRAVTPEPKDA